MSKKYIYKCSVKWKEKRIGTLKLEGKPDIEVATPPEFSGHPGIISPEDLLVSAVNSCLMTTFLFFAVRENLEFISYESDIEGDLEMKDLKMQFTNIRIFPKIKVKSADLIEKAKDLIEKSEKNCLISNSLKANVALSPEVTA
jgi:peroxiredoxin-like protein